MNFLSLENQEVQCGCFQTNQQIFSQIFRSNSVHCETYQSKIGTPKMLKRISDTVHGTKKSLKNKKLKNITFSQNKSHSRQLSSDQSNFSELKKQFSNQIQPKTSNFTLIKTPTFNKNFYEIQQSITIIKTGNKYHPNLYENKIMFKRYSSSNFQSQHLNKQNKIDEKLVQEEFKKDFEQFELEMQKSKQKLKVQGSKTQSMDNQFQKRIIFEDKNKQLKVCHQLDQKQVFTQEQINDLQEEIQRTILENQKKIEINNLKAVELNKIQSIPQILLQSQQKNHLFEVRKLSTPRQKKNSFRNSAIGYSQHQIKTKKLRDKIYAKEIQSQKDGLSSQSSVASQVVGRGWDGLTEQKIQIQGLDEMIFNDKKNGKTETMITQQSQIKNSQVKTFTQYTNSFINPRTHRPTSLLFGSPLPKYGVTGMSYQQIGDFGRLNNSFLLPRHL